MKKVLLVTILGLFSINTFASSLACENAINNVVASTANYELVVNSTSSYELVKVALETMNSAIQVANDICK